MNILLDLFRLSFDAKIEYFVSSGNLSRIYSMLSPEEKDWWKNANGIFILAFLVTNICCFFSFLIRIKCKTISTDKKRKVNKIYLTFFIEFYLTQKVFRSHKSSWNFKIESRNNSVLIDFMSNFYFYNFLINTFWAFLIYMFQFHGVSVIV